MPYDGPFIDFHTHLFPERLHRAILDWFETKAGWNCAFKEPWPEAVGFLEGMGKLERYVAFGYAHKPGIARELNRFYAELMAVSPKCVALMCAHQDDSDLAGLVEEGFRMGLKGVKLHCQVQDASPSDRRFDPLYERVIANGGLVMLHAGTGPIGGAFVGFDQLRPLLDRFPELCCVVAHLGCFEQEKFLEEALARENLYLDTAYTFIDNPTNRMEAPLELLERSARKVLFATDFPGICHDYDAAFRAIANLGLSSAASELIFHDNAATLLERIGARPACAVRP